MKRYSLRYSILTSKLDQLWFPVAFFGLFVIIAVMLRNQPQFTNVARSYIGVAIPLVAGILSAYSILEDPAIELRFATPIQAVQTLLEKLGLIFVVQAAMALIFQGIYKFFGGDFSMYTSFLQLQLAWLIPTISMMMLGCICSLLAANSIIGALIVGMVWLVQLIGRGWFAQNLGKYLLVFMAPLMPDHPDLNANLISLSILSVLLFACAALLLRRQERYI